jgi:stage III sporulation protein AD
VNAIYAALICVAGALLSAVIKQQRPELALGVALSAGVAAIAVCLPELKSAVGTLSTLADSAGVDQASVKLMLRACGISIIAEFGSQVCVDAGESALAGRIQLGARLVLLAMAVPLITEILSRVSSLLY